jgi:signal peptidase
VAEEKLRMIWKNEYFQTAVTVATMLIIVFGLYYGSQIILGTEYPALAVASGSMLPTLNVGDLIIVQRADPEQISVGKLSGDILVFRNPRNRDELIVHRAVDIKLADGYYLITTRGDNTYGEKDQFSPWDSSLLVGKVVCRIPFIGNIPLFLHSERNMYIFILITLIILIVLMFPFSFGRKANEEKFGVRSDLRSIVYYLAINVLAVAFLIFSIWGSFTFWQPGASPPQATVFGMYSDLQFHHMFAGEPYLSQGFMSYKIDCKLDGGLRLGVPTFSWYQLTAIFIALFNVWKLTGFLKCHRH